MHIKVKEKRLIKKLKWKSLLKRIKLLLTSTGKPIPFSLIICIWLNKKALSQKTESLIPIKSEISVLLLILIQERQRRPNEFFFIQEDPTRLVISMREIHKWTGWNRKKREALPSSLLLQQLFGEMFVSISSILLVTSILPQKLSVHFVF